jgi:hypothetical protein
MTKHLFKILVMIFLLVTNIVFCQKNKSNRSIGSYELLYGTRLYTNSFYDQLNTFDNYSYGIPIQLVGIGYSGGFEVSRAYNFFGHWSYSQVVPQNIIINDSLSANVNGFLFSFSVFGWNLIPKSKIFNIHFNGGFNTGRLRLSKNEFLKQKNPFFSPKLTIQPKLAIGKVVLSIRADYEIDISSNSWRRTASAKGDKIPINTFNQSGATLFLSLGYRIG